MVGLNRNQQKALRQSYILKQGYIEKICRYCGALYKTVNARVGFCSHRCQNTNWRRVANQRNTERWRKDKRNSYLRVKLQANREWRIKSFVHKTVWRYLRHGIKPTNSKIAAALPYSIPQLKAHLEAQFDNANGFTWENYGTLWELDHIVPQAMFHFTSLDEKAFRDCWALGNLRPLKCHDNLMKRDTVIYG